MSMSKLANTSMSNSKNAASLIKILKDVSHGGWDSVVWIGHPPFSQHFLSNKFYSGNIIQSVIHFFLAFQKFQLEWSLSFVWFLCSKIKLRLTKNCENAFKTEKDRYDGLPFCR